LAEQGRTLPANEQSLGLKVNAVDGIGLKGLLDESKKIAL
jgi:hypothetical protein